MTTLALTFCCPCLGNVQGVADFITNLDGILYAWMHMNFFALSLHLYNAEKYYICVSLFFLEKSVSRALWVLCRKIKQNYAFPVGLVHCSWDLQVL